MEYKKGMRGTSLYYLEMHPEVIDRFKREMIDVDSYNDFDYLVYEEHPTEFKIILQDYDMRMFKKLELVISYFTQGKSKILYVVGARDSGKSCFSFWLAEEIHRLRPKMKISYVGVKVKRSILPEWCDNYENINEVPNGSFIILDELAIQYNAREYQQESNIQLSQLLAIARHKDLSVIAITQDPNMGEINVWRLKDMIVYKRSNTYELPDRDNRRTSKIMQFWMYIKRWMKPTRQEQALFEYQALNKVMLFKYSLPNCWTENLSKAFKFVNVFNSKETKPKTNKIKIETAMNTSECPY